MLLKLNDDTIFTAKLGIVLLVCLQLISIADILKYFGLIDGLPVFSDVYLYNKLSWYPFIFVVVGLVLLYFGKKRTKVIIEKYSAKDNFFSIGNILLFLLLFIVPIVITAKLSNPALAIHNVILK